jgi:hypothetical protein
MTAAYAEKLDGITPSSVYMLTDNVLTSSVAGAVILTNIPIAANTKMLFEVIGYRSTTSTTSGMSVRFESSISQIGSPYVRFGLEHWTATSVSRTSLTADTFYTNALEGAGSTEVLPFRAYATIINVSVDGFLNL